MDKHSSLLARRVVNEGIFFLQFRPGVNVIKLFSFVTDNEPYKLEGFSLETLSSQVLEFVDKARANPIGAPFRCFLLG